MSLDDRGNCNNSSSNDYFWIEDSKPNTSSKTSFSEYSRTYKSKTNKKTGIYTNILISVIRSWVLVFLVDHIALLSLGTEKILQYSLGIAITVAIINFSIGTRLFSRCVEVFFWTVIPYCVILAFRGVDIELSYLMILLVGTGGFNSVIVALVYCNVW